MYRWSRKAIIFLKVTKQWHLHTILDKTHAWYIRQKFGGYKFGIFSRPPNLPMFLPRQYFPLYDIRRTLNQEEDVGHSSETTQTPFNRWAGKCQTIHRLTSDIAQCYPTLFQIPSCTICYQRCIQPRTQPPWEARHYLTSFNQPVGCTHCHCVKERKEVYNMQWL